MIFELSESQGLLMFALLVLWGLLLFGGYAFGTMSEDDKSRMPTWTRIASSVTLVLAGWVWYTITGGTNLSQLALMFALGMTLGFIGDLFMAELIPFGNHVLGGMGAFGLGHVFYIAGLYGFGNDNGYDASNTRLTSLIIWMVIAVVLWYLVVYRGAKARSILHIAALPYALLLAGTAACATGLALQTTGFVVIALGAALFLISDLILAAELFNGFHFKGIGDIIWLTYGPGQMFIVFGIVLHFLL